MEQRDYKWLYFFIALAVLVNFSGLFVPLMDPDAGVYASVTKYMVEHNDYVNLYFQGTDWLDKPHFPFWITAIFFKIFGLHEWSYKLPGILFVMLGAWYTYLFCRKFYNKTIALGSVFFLLTAQHILVSNNDVRAEPFLTGLIIASIYHFSRALEKNFSIHLIVGCLFAACAMMTKGLFTLVPIGAAIAGQLITTGNWKQVFHWKWLVALVFLILFITPELYCLWSQFDQHPEKIMFGREGVSGIRFFLWDSQFGRFMNTGPIKGKGDPLFFLHTLLWAFLPWALLMYAALIKKFRDLGKSESRKNGEWFSFFASILTLLVFSVSKFQLPYYANIIFPMLSILSVSYLWNLGEKGSRVFGIIQTIIAFLIPGLIFVLFFYFKPPGSIISFSILFPLFFLLIFMPQIIKRNKRMIPYFRSGLAVLIAALFLNLIFYPSLLKYQSGNQVAFYVNKNYPGQPLGRFHFYMPSGEFYLHEPMRVMNPDSVKQGFYPVGQLLYVSEEDKRSLEYAKVPFALIKEFQEFHVTMLTLKFLNPETREKELKKFYLVKLL